LGELFRIYSFGYEWNDYKAGLFLILTDRYFDTIPLLLLLLGFTSASEGVLLGIVLILMIFIVIITVVYCIFPSTYKYLNRFLILNSNSERGIKVLDVMKKFRHWYVYVRELVKGRETILLVLSSCAWLMEYGTLYCLIAGTGNIFHSLDFLEYMNSVFMRGTNDYVSQYTAISALVLGGAVACVYGSQFVRGKRCQK